MLVDEVLAVGDAAFGQKCIDVFRAKRDAGKTIVLVTHDMGSVQEFCDRAMLIHDGEQRFLGDPDEAVLRYYRLNFTSPADAGRAAGGEQADVRLVDAWLEDLDGRGSPTCRRARGSASTCSSKPAGRYRGRCSGSSC